MAPDCQNVRATVTELVSTAYAEFLERKSQVYDDYGFEPSYMPDFLFDFQHALVEWAIRKGRAALFADCGLGKTPMQLDVIDRALVLWSNPGENVLTPFMGVGSEVYGAVRSGRRGIGVELKPSYYRQAVKNVAAAATDQRGQQVIPVGAA